MNNRLKVWLVLPALLAAGWWLWSGLPGPEQPDGGDRPAPVDAGSLPAWRLAPLSSDPAFRPDSERSAGIAHLPPGLGYRLHALEPPESPAGFSLPLPDGRRLQPESGTITRHPNGDFSVHVRGPGDGLEQATLTWGNNGVFGRIQTEDRHYQVVTDGLGSWLVDLNDPRLTVDHFGRDAIRIGAEEPIGDQPTATARAPEGEPGPELSLHGGEHDRTRIDVMFVYTPDMLARYPDGLIETRLNHLVAIANQTMVDSGVDGSIRLVHHQAVDYTRHQANHRTLGDLREALAGEDVPGLETLDNVRRRHTADIVALTWPHDIETRGSCGIAYFPVERDNGSHDASYGVHIDNDGISNWSVCSDAVFTHELGHNLNAQHQRATYSDPEPEDSNFAFVRDQRFHTIMGSFGTGDVNRYLRLNMYSTPDIRCGGEPCGSRQTGEAADNATTVAEFVSVISGYHAGLDDDPVARPDPSRRDQDDDGLIDRNDPWPFDPHNGEPQPDMSGIAFAERKLKSGAAIGDHDLLVVSSGDDAVYAFSPQGEFRAVAAVAQPTDPGPLLTEYSDLLVDDRGMLYLLASADVHRYDRLSARLVDVFLSSRRPEPHELLSAFPRALVRLPAGELAVLGDSAIERFDPEGERIDSISGDDPAADPANWNERVSLAMRAAVHADGRFFLAEATDNRILVFDADSGARVDTHAGSLIEDPRDLVAGPDDALYLANGDAGNVLRIVPGSSAAPTEFIAADSGLKQARALAFGPDGSLYVADGRKDEVMRFNGDSGDRLDSVIAAESGWLDQPTALAFAPSLDEIVPGQTGAYYLPERNGEGWLLQILPDGLAAMGWFTYPDNDQDEQAWLVGVGEATGNRVVFDEVERISLSEAPGRLIDYDRDSRIRQDWGEIVFDFHGCDHGEVHYAGPGAGQSGRLPFERLVSIPGLPCGDRPAAPGPNAPGISGQWYDPVYDGQGWFLHETQTGEVFVAWFTYDGADGSPAWITGLGEMVDGRLHFPELTLSVGTRFGDAFDAGEIEQIDFGTLTFDFHDCQQAGVSFDSVLPEFGDGEMSAIRLTWPQDLACDLAAQ